MIRFLSDGKRGRVLGLGLSFDNLRLLAQRQPIVFDLAPYDSRGQFVLACGSVDEVVRFIEASGLAGSYTVRVDEERLARLREGEALPLDLAALGVPNFTDAIVFAGPTEFEIIEQLRSVGLVQPDTAFEGIEEYQRHEAGLVPDCALCQARAHGRPVATPTKGNAPLRSVPPFGAVPRPSPIPWRAVLRSPLARMLALCVVVGTVVGGLLTTRPKPRRLARDSERESAQHVQERTRFKAAETSRRKWLDATDRDPLRAELTTSPCPVAVTAPTPLGSVERQVVLLAASSPPAERLSRMLQAYAIYGPGFDVMPADASGVGPVPARMGASPLLAAHYPVAWPTLVVEQWTDPVFEADAGAQTPADAGDEAAPDRADGGEADPASTPGTARVRLLVWGYAEQRWICGTPPVLARLPSAAAAYAGQDISVLRLELVLTAFATSLPALVAVARAGGDTAPATSTQ